MPKKARRLGRFGFKIASIEKLPTDIIGVYAFFYRDRCIYVGQAKDQCIKDRIWQHYKRCHNAALSMWIDAYQRDLEFCVFGVKSVMSGCYSNRFN